MSVVVPEKKAVTQVVYKYTPIVPHASAESWATVNPVLVKGVMVYEDDDAENPKFKLGDGETAYNDLAYLPTSGLSGETSSTKTINAAGVKTLHSAPFELIAAPASGRFAYISKIVLVNNFNTVPFNFASGTQFTVEYGDGSAILTFSDDFSNVTETGWILFPAAQRMVSGGLPDALQVVLKATSDATLGDGEWVAYITYLTIQI